MLGAFNWFGCLGVVDLLGDSIVTVSHVIVSFLPFFQTCKTIVGLILSI